MLSRAIEPLEGRSLLTNIFNVDSFADVQDANEGDGVAADSDGRTTLRAAVMEANALAGSDIINLGGGLHYLAIFGDDDEGRVGDLDITEDLTINGESPETTIIDARSIDRLFHVLPNAVLTLSNLTLQNGNTINRGDGGALLNGGGSLVLVNVIVEDCVGDRGGAIASTGGTVTIQNSTIENNSAFNTGDGLGGGMYVTGGAVTISQSALIENSAPDGGGGLAATGGSITIQNSTIAQNSVGFESGDGAGLHIAGAAQVNLLATTVAFNTAGNTGAGIWVSGTLNLERSLIADNFSIASPMGGDGFIAGGTVASQGFNLIGNNDGFNFTPNAGDIIGTPSAPIFAGLGPVGEFGGLTPSVGLMESSPAVDAGPTNASPLATDQRGLPRVSDGNRDGTARTDIGAFELQGARDFYVDDAGNRIIVNAMAGDFRVDTDQGSIGILDAGDIVTFLPNSFDEVSMLVWGDRAFDRIADAVAAVGTSPEAQNEIELGPGIYSESVTLDRSNTRLHGSSLSFFPGNTVIDAGGSSFGIRIAADNIEVSRLSVANAAIGIDVSPSAPSPSVVLRDLAVENSQNDGIRIRNTQHIQIAGAQVALSGGDGLNVSGAEQIAIFFSEFSQNVGDGVSVDSTAIALLEDVIAAQNADRGLRFATVNSLLLEAPQPTANANGNLIDAVDVVLLEPSEGMQDDRVTVTSSELRLGFGMAEEPITKNGVRAVFIGLQDGNDELIFDFSAGPPADATEYFARGEGGFDRISAVSDADFVLGQNLLSIVGFLSVPIEGFEAAELIGGPSANLIQADDFFGPVTLRGGDANDTLVGSLSDDLLSGEAGDDVLKNGPFLRTNYIGREQSFEAVDLDPSGSNVTTLISGSSPSAQMIDLGTNTFRFGGQSVGSSNAPLWIGANGLASLFSPPPAGNNVSLVDLYSSNESPVVPSQVLAPLWDDWITGGFGVNLPNANVLYRFDDLNGDQLDDRLVVEWSELYHVDHIDFSGAMPALKPTASPVTFQLILELNTVDRDGDVIFNYVDLDAGGIDLDAGASATVGIVEAGFVLDGIRQISVNQTHPLVGSNQAILFRQTLNDGSDTLDGGQGNDTLVGVLGFDSLQGGTDSDEFVFASADNPFDSQDVLTASRFSTEVTDSFFGPNTARFDLSSVERVSLNLGAGTQQLSIDSTGLNADVSVDAGGSLQDSITLRGTPASDNLQLSGGAITQNASTLQLANIEQLSLDLTQGGADTVDVQQNFTGAVGLISITGDSDDVVAVASTVRAQNVLVDPGHVQLIENTGGQAIFLEALVNNSQDAGGTTISNQVTPLGITLSPDGRRAYVASSGSNALVVYDRDPLTGRLSFSQSFVDGAQDAFGNTITGLRGANSVAESADGRFVYVVSSLDSTVALFERLESGEVKFISSSISGPNGPVLIDAATGLTVSPDGHFLIVVSPTSNKVFVLERSFIDNSLFLLHSIEQGQQDNQSNTFSGLAGVRSVAVSADGRHAYLTGADDNAVAVIGGLDDFPGNIFFIEALQDGGVDGAGNTIQGLDGASSVAVSSDGARVYVAGSDSNAVAVFNRDADTGRLTFLEMLADGGVDSLGNTVSGLGGASSVTVSPDGNLVYVAGPASNAIAVFDRSVTGLTVRHVLQNGSADPLGNSYSGFSGVVGIAISSNGRHIYSIGKTDNAVSVLQNPIDLTLDIQNIDRVNLTTSVQPDDVQVQLGSFSELNIDAGGSASDLVTFRGTAGDDIINVSGTQVVFSGSMTTTTNAETVKVMGDGGDDVVNVVAAAVNYSLAVDGGSHASGDRLNVDASQQPAVDSGTIISVSNLQNVSYANVESVRVFNTPPVINPQQFNIAENSALGSPVGTVLATDPDDGVNLIWRITAGNPANAFAIDSQTGEVTVNGSLDFETTASYPLTIEVEDTDGLVSSSQITVTITDVVDTFDFGDAPASYGVNSHDDGARHGISDLFLGNSVDQEIDGQPSADALADDVQPAAIDDEDGVTFLSALIKGTLRQLRALASRAGFLDGWIDFDQDGQFEPSEHITGGQSMPLAPGFNIVDFNVPNSAAEGMTFARFRLSETGNLGPNGAALSGEVEDYMVEVMPLPQSEPVESNDFTTTLDTAVNQFFQSFPDELNEPDPNFVPSSSDPPLAVQAEGGANAQPVNANVGNSTDPALRNVVDAVNDQVAAGGENVFVLVLHPVDFLLTDPQGRSVGFTQDTGFVNNIGSNVTYSGDGIVELLTIRNASAGTYGLQIVGVGGVFRGGASLVTPTGTQQITFQGSLQQRGQVQLALDYAPPPLPQRGFDVTDYANVVGLVSNNSNGSPNGPADSTAAVLGTDDVLKFEALSVEAVEVPRAAQDDWADRFGVDRTRVLEGIRQMLTPNDEDFGQALERVLSNEQEFERVVETVIGTIGQNVANSPERRQEFKGAVRQFLQELRENDRRRSSTLPTDRQRSEHRSAQKPRALSHTGKSPQSAQQETQRQSSFPKKPDKILRRDLGQTTGRMTHAAKHGSSTSGKQEQPTNQETNSAS